MDIKIMSIILWPRDSSKAVRKINFNPNKINIITGQSQTGKSALIPIIDYCLGSSKCTIPVGPIRDKTEWFGILLELPSSQLILARREPGDQIQTSEMYMAESTSLEIFPRPYKTCNVNSVKNRLNELAGLPRLDFEGGDAELSFGKRPSIRDMAAFEFQPQHIIANPYTLFFKADTYAHQEKLKIIFPLVLGVIDNRTLILKRELEDLKHSRSIKQRKLDYIKSASHAWIANIRASYSKAKELGLLPNSPDPSNMPENDPEKFINYLRTVPEFVLKMGMPKIDEGGTERVVREINRLEQEEEDIAYAIDLSRQKLIKLEKLFSSEMKYETALNLQAERLSEVNWFCNKLDGLAECPFCKSKSDSALKEITILLEASKELINRSSSVKKSIPILDKEIADVKKDLIEFENKINIIRTNRELLEDKQNKAKLSRQTLSEIYRFVGGLEQSLNNLQFAQEDSDLSREIDELDQKIKAIEAELNPSLELKKKLLALSMVSQYMSHYIKMLDVERPDDPVQLDINNLTIKILDHVSKREDYLWEIGSGANWMGYHLAALLGLHEHFMSLGQNPVPQFLIIDQPSQVYFPERWPLDPNPKNPKGNQKEINSDDIERTHKIFETLSSAITRNQGKLQIILIDHADEIVWEGIDNIHLVERWRGGNALIPSDW